MTEIWYFGDSSKHSNSFRRYLALHRLGCSVSLFDPYSQISKLMSLVSWKTGYKLIQSKIYNWLISQLSELNPPDLIWVDSGDYFGRDCLRYLREYKKKIILYNVDDPTGYRDGNRFNSLLQSIPFYDLCVVRREINEIEYKCYGAIRTLRMWLSFDELVHQNSEYSRTDLLNISFIGTFIPGENRDQFIYKMICSGLSLEIWGGRWDRSPLYRNMKFKCHGPAVGSKYTDVIQNSAISLGFLSYSNRDIHTRRSLEIPASGGLLCAERTSEHQLLFEEGREAVYWSSNSECIEVCKYLIKNPDYRETIRKAGMKKVREIGVGNEDVCRQILSLML